MSDTTETTTSVLLPAARVGLYVLDADIREAAKALATDWRFARVVFDIHEGDVDTAIAAYSGQDSPEFLMVETRTIDDSFTQKLEVLASSCAAHTSAVVVGPDNDVYLYRKLIQMGVSDYLVRPLRKEVIAEVIAKTLIEKLGTTDSRLIAYIGAKGGVGTSTLAQATAMAVAGKLDQKTIILDAAGGWSYLSVAMGTEPITSLSEAVRASQGADQDSFRRMLFNTNDKLTVLASGADAMLGDPTTADAYEAMINKLMVTYPVVIVDLSGAAPSICRAVMHKAHEVVIVSEATLPSLRSARSLINEIKAVRGNSDKDIELVINKKDATPHEVSLPDITEALERKPVLAIPFMPKLFAVSETQGKPLMSLPGAEDLIGGLLALARKVISGEEVKPGADKQEGRILGGLLGKLKAK